MNDPRIQAVLDQLDTLLLLLMRPAVQKQLLAFLLVTLIAWLIPIPFRLFVAWLDRRLRGPKPKGADPAASQPSAWQTRLVRWLRAGEFVLFPIFGLFLGGFAVGYLGQRHIPFGLLDRLNNLYWLLLAYRVLGALLYAFAEIKTAQRYQRRFLTPIFLILLITSLSVGFAGSFALGEITLFQIMGQALSLPRHHHRRHPLLSLSRPRLDHARCTQRLCPAAHRRR